MPTSRYRSALMCSSVAAHDARWANICKTRPPQEIVEVMNQAVVAQARTMVWGVDDSQLKFVEEWMSQSPDRPLLSRRSKRGQRLPRPGKTESRPAGKTGAFAPKYVAISPFLAYSVRYLTAFFAREAFQRPAVGSEFEGAGTAEDVNARRI